MKRIRIKVVLAGCAVALAMLSLANGCATVAQVAAAAGEASGVITPQQAQGIVRTGEAFGKALEQITPEQEYYVGRAVGATVVSQYKVHDRDVLTRYLNVLGQTLAMASDKPETFGGYHFLVLESDEINAFAAPGGLIFLSRGMLKLCRNEDELAAVLAHEVGHVQLGHAISAISNSRWTQAFTILGTESAKGLGGEQISQLTAAFEGSINDITKTMMTSGYARKQEREADRVAVTILQRVGYRPSALIAVLQNMERQLKPGGHDFASTHPPPASRVEDLQSLLGAAAGQAPVQQASRQRRFARALTEI